MLCLVHYKTLGNDLGSMIIALVGQEQHTGRQVRKKCFLRKKIDVKDAQTMANDDKTVRLT